MKLAEWTRALLVSFVLVVTQPWYIWLIGIILYPFVEVVVTEVVIAYREVKRDGQARRE